MQNNHYYYSNNTTTTTTNTTKMEWTRQTYNSQYDKWVPWAEDMYLRYFTSDNKASYATKRKSTTITT